MKLNEMLGFSIYTSESRQKDAEKAVVCNFAVGLSLIAAGAAFSSGWCAALGPAMEALKHYKKSLFGVWRRR